MFVVFASPNNVVRWRLLIFLAHLGCMPGQLHLHITPLLFVYEI